MQPQSDPPFKPAPVIEEEKESPHPAELTPQYQPLVIPEPMAIIPKPELVEVKESEPQSVLVIIPQEPVLSASISAIEEPKQGEEIQSLILNDLVPDVPKTIEIEMFHGVPLEKLYQEFYSNEFRDLEKYILSLDLSPKWKQIGKESSVEGFKLSRSKFSSEVPVVRYLIDFGQVIPSEFVLNMFGDPSFRMNWDPRIEQMNKIYQEEDNYFLHYHILRFNAPLKNRDFLTRYYLRKIGNETRVVLKSVKHEVKLRKEFPESEETTRTKTYFGMYRVFEESTTTRMSITIQFNLYFAVKAMEDLVPEFVLHWLEKYRNQTVDHYTR